MRKFAIPIICVVMMGCPKGGDHPSPGPVPPSPPGPTPVIENSDPKLSAFYAAFADVLERDNGQQVKTVGQLREINRKALSIAFNFDKKPGLGAKIDSRIMEVTGDVVASEIPTEKVVDLFRIMSAEFAQGTF